MAGIGFELRKIMSGRNIFSTVKAHAYAGVLSAGPWVIAIAVILLLNLIKRFDVSHFDELAKFQTSITYLIAFSLIVSGIGQYSVTRFISDLIYKKAYHRIVPSFNGLLLLMMAFSGILATVIMSVFFSNQPALYRVEMIACFVALCCVWMTQNLLSGMRAYRPLLYLFLIAYLVILGLGFALYSTGYMGLLGAFYIGNMVLLAGMLFLVYRTYQSDALVSFDFFEGRQIYLSLVLSGFLFSVGLWVDKIMFWYFPGVGEKIIGVLYASPIYDIPIFLAYVTMIPGMSVFLFRMETEFVEHYSRYFAAIEQGDTLQNIQNFREQMVAAARQGMLEIIKIQAFVTFIIFVTGKKLLGWLGLSPFYSHILNVDTLGASLQIIFLGFLNILLYLNRRKQALILTSTLAVLNAGFTLVTLFWGVMYYGYGMTLAVLVVDVMAIWYLDQDFAKLEYTTFTLQ